MQTGYPNGKYTDPQPVQQLLGTGSLHHIIQKAKTLMRIHQALMEILPDNCHRHCRVMNLRDEKLLIEADNAALATNLRYSQAEIIQKLRKFSRLPCIKFLEVKVRFK